MSSVWETLSKIDCAKHVEKKGKFSYLAWTWAWAMVKDNYPNARYNICPDIVFPDGTMEVRMEVLIPNGATDTSGLIHEMWLPVLNFQNKAIQNPNAFDINTSRMRCLVKCLAMFGLGHYIYAGESVPQSDPFTPAQKKEFIGLIADRDGFGLKFFDQEAGHDVVTELFNDAPKNQKTKMKDAVREIVQEANDMLKAMILGVEEAIDASNLSAIEEIYESLSEVEEGFLKVALTEVQHHQVEQLKAAA